jgi:hypothetical protein
VRPERSTRCHSSTPRTTPGALTVAISLIRAVHTGQCIRVSYARTRSGTSPDRSQRPAGSIRSSAPHLAAHTLHTHAYAGLIRPRETSPRNPHLRRAPDKRNRWSGAWTPARGALRPLGYDQTAPVHAGSPNPRSPAYALHREVAASPAVPRRSLCPRRLCYTRCYIGADSRLRRRLAVRIATCADRERTRCLVHVWFAETQGLFVSDSRAGRRHDANQVRAETSRSHSSRRTGTNGSAKIIRGSPRRR